MFLILPVDKLSITVTLFSNERVLVRLEPINPAPPVTIIFLSFILKPTFNIFMKKLQKSLKSLYKKTIIIITRTYLKL